MVRILVIPAVMLSHTQIPHFNDIMPIVSRTRRHKSLIDDIFLEGYKIDISLRLLGRS
jgi:hypothetical protein